MEREDDRVQQRNDWVPFGPPCKSRIFGFSDVRPTAAAKWMKEGKAECNNEES